MFKANTYLAELRVHAADIVESCEKAYQTLQMDLDFLRIDKKLFESCRAESIDYAVMENTRNAVVVPQELPLWTPGIFGCF